MNHSGWPKNFAPLMPTPPLVGDIDGDAREEIIIGTYDPGRNPSTGSIEIFALDGSLKHSLPIPGGVKHIPALADLDRDGSTELIVRALDGRDAPGGAPRSATRVQAARIVRGKVIHG